MTAFEQGWTVVKGWEVSEDFDTGICKGCGDVHTSPNSDYCSEICEKQNPVTKADDPPLGVHAVFDGMKSNNLDFYVAVGQVAKLLSLDRRKLAADCKAYADSGAQLYRNE